MQPVTKIIYQIKVCSSFIKSQRKCKSVINQEIVENATVRFVIKKVNLYKQRALSSEITSSSIIGMIIEAKTQILQNLLNWFVKYEHV